MTVPDRRLEGGMTERQLTVHSGPDRVSGLIHQHTSIIIELQNRTVGSLHLLCCANNNSMPDIPSTDLVRDTRTRRVFGAEVSLLLNDDDNPVT